MSNNTVNTVQSGLEKVLIDSLVSLNLGVSKNTLQQAVRKVTASTAPVLVSSVSSTANQQLNSIPKTLIGIKNPVDLVTQNNSSIGITNTLVNSLDVKLTDTLTTQLLASLQAELKLTIPKEKQGLINFNSLESALRAPLTAAVSGSVKSTLNEFSTGIFSKNINIEPVLPDIEKVFDQFGTAGVDDALDKIDESYVISNATRYLQQSKNFDVTNDENQEKLKVVSKGFTDPNANYPTKEYNGRPDTNRLATGEINGTTIVQEKNKNRMIGAKLPGGDAWDEPESAYRAEYPYNKVTQTESGHIIEMDDTPGSERIHVYHKAGTYVEIDSNGSMVRRIRGSSYEIIDRNGKISIQGRADISINGACNIYVGNDANIEVEGDTNLTCYNDVTMQAAGNFNISAKDNINITSANINIQAYNEMSLMANTALKMHSSNAISVLSNAEITTQSVDNFTKTTRNHYTEIGKDLHTYVIGSAYNYTDGEYHVKAVGTFNVDGELVHLNSGTSQNASQSKNSVIANISRIGVLPSRKDVVYITAYDPSALVLADNYTLDNEEGKQIAFEQKQHRDKLVIDGIASTQDLDRTPVEQQKIDITSAQTIDVPGSEDLKKATSLPGNFKLSPNFTIEMLSSKAAVTKDEIESDELPYGQIVFNLQQVALNVLEPLYNLYPNAFVTSGYRKRSKSSKTSQHPLGLAVDVQFKGVSKQEYFEIAKRLAKVLKYDQLLLEYSAYTNNPWIHISYTGIKDRAQVLTFWNNKVHTTGLAQLA